MTNKNDKIIIIGAGFAGLTAAKLLMESGFEVTVLEADNRIGGRTNTIQLGKATVDTGATWIHFKDGNPLTHMAELHGYQVFNDDYEPFNIFNSKKKKLSDKKKNKYIKLADKIRERAIEYFQENRGDKTTEDFFEEYVQSKNWSIKKIRFVKFLYSALLETDYAASIDKISLSDVRYITQFNKNYDNDGLIVGGFGKLVEILRQGLDIRLSEIVETIDYSKNNNSNKIIITTNKGTFKCDKVIVTVSLGVLKNERIKFIPQLPYSKLNAIKSMGFGNLEKIILTFENRFWGKERLIYYYAQKDKNLPFPIIMDFTKVAGSPTLALYYAADFATELLKRPDIEILELAIGTLQNIFKRSTVKPINYHISHWSTDPFHFGSYSYSRNDEVGEIIKTLGEPIDNTVFFAGEATSLKGQAYVHGALLSGIREALRFGANLDGIKGINKFSF